MPGIKILIAGAGLGGLCLAQSLRRSGIDVRVFERDASPWVRAQGYRLHLDVDGIHALKEVLSPELYALFDATSMRAVDSTTIVSTGLDTLKRVPSNEHGGNVNDAGSAAGDGSQHVNVNRATLRQIVLAGLEDVCTFDAGLEHYESDADGVTAVFSDGSRVRGDVLVGADGIHSTVRRQRAPDARQMDSGVRAIYGRIPLSAAREYAPPHVLEDVFTVASDKRKVFLGLGPVIFPTRPDVASRALMPEARLSSQDDYLVCIVGGRREYFGRSDRELRKMRGSELQDLAVTLLSEWPTNAADLPAHGDGDSFFFVEMHTSIPCTLGPATNVTLLGDAIHAMTPTLGRGANVAMRDAALLGRHIAVASRGNAAVARALTGYESEMIPYGFAVVRDSVRMGQRLTGQEPLPE